MTGAQKKWLDANRQYRPISQPGGHIRWTHRGVLHADGKFEITPRGVRPAITPGCFEVGILQAEPPSGALRQ